MVMMVVSGGRGPSPFSGTSFRADAGRLHGPWFRLSAQEAKGESYEAAMVCQTVMAWLWVRWRLRRPRRFIVKGD